jgi:hypothetical protein
MMVTMALKSMRISSGVVAPATPLLKKTTTKTL